MSGTLAYDEGNSVDSETQPARTLLNDIDELTGEQRRIATIALFLLARCPLTENPRNDRLDVVRDAFELIGHEPTVGRLAYQV